jgi:hypothetical protein
MEILMRLSWIVAQLALVFACSHRSQNSSDSGSLLPKRGDRVLVESNAAQFYEARVITEATQQLRVQAMPSGDTALVQAADTYRLPTQPVQLAPQSLAICNVDRGRWIGCRIASTQPGGARAYDADGNSYDIAWSQIVLPNPLTELNLRRLFDKAGERHDFDRDMAKAGPPYPVPGWQPIGGRSVLARIDGKWWLSVVVSSKHGMIRVRLAGVDRTIEVDRSDIAPEPPYPMDVLQKSHLALLRPAGVGQAWSSVRLVSIDQLEAVVEDVSRGRRVVPVRDVCPLGHQ